MSNLFMLFVAAAVTPSLCACSITQQTIEPEHRPTIVVQPPKGEEGDFILCKDGRVLVFPVSHPLSCA